MQSGPTSEDAECVYTRWILGEYKANVNCFSQYDQQHARAYAAALALHRCPDQEWIKGSHLAPSGLEGSDSLTHPDSPK